MAEWSSWPKIARLLELLNPRIDEFYAGRNCFQGTEVEKCLVEFGSFILNSSPNWSHSFFPLLSDWKSRKENKTQQKSRVMCAQSEGSILFFNIPTNPFTISELQNPSHDVPELHKFPDLLFVWFLILWKGSSGCGGFSYEQSRHHGIEQNGRQQCLLDFSAFVRRFKVRWKHLPILFKFVAILKLRRKQKKTSTWAGTRI